MRQNRVCGDIRGLDSAVDWRTSPSVKDPNADAVSPNAESLGRTSARRAIARIPEELHA
jgi:hypothetical protein